MGSGLGSPPYEGNGREASGSGGDEAPVVGVGLAAPLPRLFLPTTSIFWAVTLPPPTLSPRAVDVVESIMTLPGAFRTVPARSRPRVATEDSVRMLRMSGRATARAPTGMASEPQMALKPRVWFHSTITSTW